MVVILIVCDLVQGIVPNALVQKVRNFENHATIEQNYGEKILNSLNSYQRKDRDTKLKHFTLREW